MKLGVLYTIIGVVLLCAVAGIATAPVLAQEGQSTEGEIMGEAIISLYNVADIWSGASSSNPSYLTVYNGALYFNANGNDDVGIELWKYDPASGAQRVADIYPGAGSSWPRDLAVYNGALYFRANGNDGAGSELRKYDPAIGAQRVADIYPGVGSSNPGCMAVYNGALYFQADGNDGAGAELWKY
ncbi:MAG: hypothetical protein LUQ25_06135, partial [Methanoregulaceae archaeon]|nr:hypothetical protein [Methanoregulaceae archaeon]